MVSSNNIPKVLFILGVSGSGPIHFSFAQFNFALVSGVAVFADVIVDLVDISCSLDVWVEASDVKVSCIGDVDLSWELEEYMVVGSLVLVVLLTDPKRRFREFGLELLFEFVIGEVTLSVCQKSVFSVEAKGHRRQ